MSFGDKNDNTVISSPLIHVEIRHHIDEMTRFINKRCDQIN